MASQTEFTDSEYHEIHDHLRDSVWEKIYNNELESRYYQELLKKHKRWERIFRFSTFLAALLMVTISIIAPNIWATVISAVPFLCFFFMDPKIVKVLKVELLKKIRSGCDVIGSMLKSLWRDMETGSLDENSAKFRLSQIDYLEPVLVSRFIEDGEFAEDRDLNIKCAKEAVQAIINNYPGATV